MTYNPYREYMAKEAFFPGAPAVDRMLQEKSPLYRKGREKVMAGVDKAVALTTREVSPEYMQAIRTHMEKNIANPVQYHDTRVPLFSKMLHGDHVRPGAERIIEAVHGGQGVRAGHTQVYAHPTRSPSVMAHELGHAQAMGANRKYFPYVNAAGKQMTEIAKKLPEGTKGRKAMMVAGQVPLLAEEARASYRGLKAIKEVHGTKEMLKGIPALAAAYGTYLNAARKSIQDNKGKVDKAVGIAKQVGRLL